MGSDFYGEVSGADDDFELVKKEGGWMLYPCPPHGLNPGETVLPISACLYMED